MHLDFGQTRAGSKVYTRVLLRESYRHEGKVKHRTIANLSHCSPEEIAAIKLAFKHKHDLGKLTTLGQFGYNRDGKRGKRQIVIGLLCDGCGVPLSIEVFAGNTSDPKTFGSQVRKVAERFGGGEVSLVGDRGMIKGPQMQELAAEHFHSITAITKPQIEKLLKEGILEMDLFDQVLAEVTEEKIRYILRRNPRRALEMDASRTGKMRRLQSKLDEANAHLASHPRSTLPCAFKKVRKQIESLKLGSWVSALQNQPGSRCIRLEIDADARAEEAKLDGCYVLKTDLTPEQASKEVVHARYKDLTLVEQAFRTSKTVELEMRPVHVRCEASTRGQALVVMLAYRLVQELARRWSSLDLTVGEGVRKLDTFCTMEMHVNGAASCQIIPEPRADIAELITLSGVKLPSSIRSRGAKAATKKKLYKNRLRR